MGENEPPALVHPAAAALPSFPRTRYQGSKRRLAAAIVHHLNGLYFTTVLDAFGGTGAVAYAFKCAGKQVTYNDHLAFNHQIGLALIENDTATLTHEQIAAIGERHGGIKYGDFIEGTFSGIYFTDYENRWLDTAVGNIRAIPCRFQRAIAWHALFQSAMAKRPYNLFHRRNLYMRTADVARGFGNKTSWDRSFPDHFAAFAAEANRAVIDSGGQCRAICGDVLDAKPPFDLVYIDTPYVNRSGVGVNYRDFYHFLEGMVRYDEWPGMIDRRSKHLRLMPRSDPWSDARQSHEMFRRLLERFRHGTLAVSYRSDGIPTISELEAMMRGVKPRVRVVSLPRYPYALSPNHESREMLLIGSDGRLPGV